MKIKLPKNWTETSFENIANATDFVANGSFKSLRENVTQTEIPDFAILVRLKDYSKKWKGDFRYVTKSSYEFLSKSSLLPGDLFIANVGYPGKLFLMPDLGMPMTIGPNGLRIRSKKYTSNTFLSYYYSSPQGKKVLDSIVSGTAQQKFNKTGLRSSNVIIPPLAEQKRIVSKLDGLFQQLERINKSLDHIPTLLKNFRQQVLTQGVTGKLLGKSSFTTLGELKINIKTGPFGSALHKSEYIENGIPVINPSHIQNGEIIPNNSVAVTISKSKELERWILKDDDVILGRRGEMGRCSLYKIEYGKMLCGTGSLILKGNDKISPKFLDFYLRSSFCINYLESNSVGSTMINLNQKIVNSLPFPVLSREEQEKSVKHLNKLFEKADVIEKHYKALKTKIEHLPQAILHKAFKGELVPQLDSDGDAKELLKEIEAYKKYL